MYWKGEKKVGSNDLLGEVHRLFIDIRGRKIFLFFKYGTEGNARNLNFG